MADPLIFGADLPNDVGLRWFFTTSVGTTRGVKITGVAGQDILIRALYFSRNAAGTYNLYDGAGSEFFSIFIPASDSRWINPPTGLFRLTTGNSVEGIASTGSGAEVMGILYQFVEPL